MEKISRERFIRLGTALGVGAAGASLAACGGGGTGGYGGGGSGGGESGDSGGTSQASSPPSGGQAKTSGEDNGKGGAKGDGGANGGGEARAGGAAIAGESEVAPGSAVAFEDAGNPAVLVHLENGNFVAYSAVCTHQGCEVVYKNGQLACPCHGSVFDPAEGAAVVTGPAPSPLPEIPVKVQGGEVVRA